MNKSLEKLREVAMTLAPKTNPEVAKKLLYTRLGLTIFVFVVFAFVIVSVRTEQQDRKLKKNECSTAISEQFIKVTNEGSRVAISDRENLTQLLKTIYAAPDDPDIVRSAISGYLARVEENNRVRPEVPPVIDFSVCS